MDSCEEPSLPPGKLVPEFVEDVPRANTKFSHRAPPPWCPAAVEDPGGLVVLRRHHGPLPPGVSDDDDIGDAFLQHPQHFPLFLLPGPENSGWFPER